MRRTIFRCAKIALVWTVAVLMFLDTASACRLRRRGGCDCQPAPSCGGDMKSGAAGGGAGVEAPPPPAPEEPAPPKPAPAGKAKPATPAAEKPAEPAPEKPAPKPAAEKPAPKPAPEKPAEPAPEKPAAEPAKPSPAKPAAAKTDDLDDLFNDAPKNPPKPAAEKPTEPTPEKPAEPAAGKPAAPAEKKPAKPADDDPFKITAEGQLAVRVWTDDSGYFRITGRLIAVLDGKVRILKETGKTTTVPLQRLSRADRTYVSEITVRYGSGVIGQVAAE